MSLSKNKKIGDYYKYQHFIKAKRIIHNASSNDWNNEPEYKLQNVRIYGETQKENYVIDSYGRYKFSCNKTQIFLDEQDLKNKINSIKDFNLTELEKEILIKQF